MLHNQLEPQDQIESYEPMELHDQLNPEQVFIRVPDAKKIDDVPDYTNRELTDLLKSCCQRESEQALIEDNILRHIAGKFIHKAELKQWLSLIVKVLTSDEEMKKLCISPDSKERLMTHLLDEMDQCEEGLMDRAQDVLTFMRLPLSIDELLSSYRYKLINDAFDDDERRESTNREIHTYNRFFVVANRMGIAVPAVLNDKYRGDKLDGEIETAIRKKFENEYTPYNIIRYLLEPTLTRIFDPEKDKLCLTTYKDEALAAYKKERDKQYNYLCNYLKLLFRDDRLNSYEFFKTRKENNISFREDLDWVKINSHLINYMYKKNYFYPIDVTNTIQLEARSENGWARIIYQKSRLNEAVIWYTDVEEEVVNKKTYRKIINLKGFLFVEASKNLFLRLPNDLREKLKEEFALTINVRQDIVNLPTLMDEDTVNTLCDSPTMFDKLWWFIRDAKTLAFVLDMLTPDVCERFLQRDTIKAKLADAIPSIMAFEKFSTRQRKKILTGSVAIYEYLASMVKTADDFNRLLRNAPKETREYVFQACKPRLPGMIKMIIDVDTVVNHLTIDQRDSLFDAVEMREQLPCLIQTVEDFKNITSYLTSAQTDALIIDRVMMAKFKLMTKSSANLNDILYLLTNNQAAVVCDGLKNHLPCWMFNIEGFVKALFQLTESMCDIICALPVVQEMLPKIVHTGEDLYCCFKDISLSLEVLDKIIGSSQNLFRLLQGLPIEKRTEVLHRYTTMLHVDNNAGINQFRDVYYDCKVSSHVPEFLQSDYLKKLDANPATPDKKWNTLITHAAANSKGRTAIALCKFLMERKGPQLVPRP